jgi:hypothetical protein
LSMEVIGLIDQHIMGIIHPTVPPFRQIERWDDQRTYRYGGTSMGATRGQIYQYRFRPLQNQPGLDHVCRRCDAAPPLDTLERRRSHSLASPRRFRVRGKDVLKADVDASGPSGTVSGTRNLQARETEACVRARLAWSWVPKIVIMNDIPYVI